MKKLRIYIDTSVMGGCFDAEFADASQALFGAAQRGDFQIVISDVALTELAAAPENVQSFHSSLPQGVLETVASKS